MTTEPRKPLLERLEPEDKKIIDDLVLSFHNLIRGNRKLTCNIGPNVYAEITLFGRDFDKKTIRAISRFLRTLGENYEEEKPIVLSLETK